VDNEEIEGNDEGLRDLMRATKLGVKQPNWVLRIQIKRYLMPNGEATQLGVNFGLPPHWALNCPRHQLQSHNYVIIAVCTVRRSLKRFTGLFQDTGFHCSFYPFQVSSLWDTQDESFP